MYIHTRRYNTTWILHFGSNVTLSSSIATPNDSRYKWKIPPLPSPPFIHSFRFFLSFLFFFFFWLTRGWAQSAPEAGVILSLTTISTIFNAIESSILFSSVFIILKSVLHAIRYRTLASLLANFRENDHGIYVYWYMCTDRCTSSWLSNTESNMRENSSFFWKKIFFS